MARALPTTTHQISTTVRTISLASLRFGYAMGSWLAPETTIRRAATLFCTPQSTTRSRALRAATQGARELTLDIDGTPIRAYTWGTPEKQPYVLFAHGWSSHGTRISPWVKPLQDAGYAVVAFDQVGHGKSGGAQATLPEFASNLLAVGRHFGPAEAVIGHSLGGAASAIALAHGLVAKRAVLIAPADDPLAMVERFSRFIGLSQHLGRRMFALFENRMHFHAEELQAPNLVPRIGRPALIVHDLEDREVPWSDGERYARFWPDARLLSTRGLGHNRIADDQDVIGAALAFMRGETVGERVVSSPNLPFGLA